MNAAQPFAPEDRPSFGTAQPAANLLQIRVVIMGVMGAGKTTVGRALADDLAILFRDGDDLHPAANVEKMRAGLPLTDEDRWGWLELVSNSLRRDAPVVIACSALRQAYRNHIRLAISGQDAGGGVRFVYLHAAPDLIAARLAQRDHPYMPNHLLGSQFATLDPPTKDEAIIVPAAWTLAQQVAQIKAALTA